MTFSPSAAWEERTSTIKLAIRKEVLCLVCVLWSVCHVLSKTLLPSNTHGNPRAITIACVVSGTLLTNNWRRGVLHLAGDFSLSSWRTIPRIGKLQLNSLIWKYLKPVISRFSYGFFKRSYIWYLSYHPSIHSTLLCFSSFRSSCFSSAVKVCYMMVVKSSEHSLYQENFLSLVTGRYNTKIRDWNLKIFS